MFSEILFCSFVAVFSVGNAQYQATRRCTKQDQCILPFECCSKRFGVPEAYCVPRRQLGELCLDYGLDQQMFNGTYDITCPCAIGLNCIKPKYYNDLGQLIYTRNPRCQAADYEQPPLEYYKNLDHGVYASGGNAYASAGNNGYGNRGKNVYASNGNNAYSSSGNNAYASSGNNAYSSSGNNAYASSGNNPYASSGNNPYASSGYNGYAPNGNSVYYTNGNNAYASSGSGNGYAPQSNAVAYA